MDIDPKFVELMHAEIDGMNSERESRELQAFLEGNPDARQTFAGLQRLAETMAADGPVEPPTDLRDSILQALPGRPGRESAGRIARLRAAWPESRVAVRYAYAAAAVLVIGLVGYFWMIQPSGLPQADPNGAVGSLVPRETTPDRAALGQLEIDETEINGLLRLEQSGHRVAVDLELQALSPAEVVLIYDPTAIEPGDPAATLGEMQELRLDEGEMRWTLHGDQRWVLFFDRIETRETTLELQLLVSGDPVYSSALDLPSMQP